MKKYLKKHWKSIVLNMIFTLIVSSLQVYAALRMMKVAELMIRQNTKIFIMEVLLIFGMWLLSLVLSYYQNIHQESLIQDICNNMRIDMALVTWNIKASCINQQD